MSAPLYALLGVSGLGDVGYRFMDEAGAWIGARVTAGVDETDAADGTYYVAAPTTPGTARSVHWNSSGTPAVKATEVFATVGDTTPSVLLANGVHGGAAATLALKSAVINNDAGVGLSVSGSTYGAQLSGVTNGGLFILSVDGVGLLAASVHSNAALFTAGDAFAGIKSVGGDTGSGLELAGGSTSGSGIKATGGAVGHGVEIIGGSVSGSAMSIIAQAGNSIGLVIEGEGSGGSVEASNAITAAMLAPDASTEIATQVNTTLAAAHGAGAWDAAGGGGGGSGAFPITVTVNDGAAALQNVSVSVYDGATLAANGTTNASGQFTPSLDAGTYTVALVKPGYTFNAVSRTVTGNQTGTLTTPLSMTQWIITVPSSPANCTVAGYIKDLQGNALPGAVLKVQLVPPGGNRPITADGNVVAFVSDEAVADANGLVTLELIRTDELEPNGCTYTFICTDAEMEERHVKLEAATFDLSTL